MFKDHKVVTDDEVGDYVKHLYQEAEENLREEEGELEEGALDELERSSTRTPRWKNNKTGLSSVR